MYNVQCQHNDTWEVRQSIHDVLVSKIKFMVGFIKIKFMVGIIKIKFMVGIIQIQFMVGIIKIKFRVGVIKLFGCYHIWVFGIK
jgi:hypothetical protein